MLIEILLLLMLLMMVVTIAYCAVMGWCAIYLM
jgi:hypothetical protein